MQHEKKYKVVYYLMRKDTTVEEIHSLVQVIQMYRKGCCVTREPYIVFST